MSEHRNGLEPETTGSRIRLLRRKRGWNQAQLATEAEVGDQGEVSRWENGRATPELPTILALANALGCSLDYLLLRSDEPALVTHSAAVAALRRIKETVDEAYNAGLIDPDGMLGDGL